MARFADSSETFPKVRKVPVADIANRTACIGLLPAAVSTGIGSQVQRPLATVVVGGMFLGPIILLVVVPAVQTLFLDRQRNASPSRF